VGEPRSRTTLLLVRSKVPHKCAFGAGRTVDRRAQFVVEVSGLPRLSRLSGGGSQSPIQGFFPGYRRARAACGSRTTVRSARPGSSEVRDLALPYTIELQSTFSLEDHAEVLREIMAARTARLLERS
jgi:hypothetical protein